MANQRKSSKKYKMKKRGGSKSKTMKKGGWPWDKPDPNAPPANSWWPFGSSDSKPSIPSAGVKPADPDVLKSWWPFGSSDSKTSIPSEPVVKPADPVVKSVAPPDAPTASATYMSDTKTMGGKQQSKKSKKSKK
jgi:hypothetical protein